ncbi:hypothetical protein [Streptomyces sp. NPDC047046]|uniref:hypothetical protein n=1 Tax=Streptomyces sp. NPDC047046 TaxID=3155378 RepID=UPI0033CD8328
MRNTEAALVGALEPLADGMVIAVAGSPPEDLPVRLLERIAASRLSHLRLLCMQGALEHPAVGQLVQRGHVVAVTQACHEPGATFFLTTDEGEQVQVEWLLYEEMAEGLRATAGGLTDFYSPGEVHTTVRRPSKRQEQGRPRAMRAGEEVFAHKAALQCDVALLLVPEADLAGNLRLDPTGSDDGERALIRAMADAAAHTVAETREPARTARLMSRNVGVPASSSIQVIRPTAPGSSWWRRRLSSRR